MIPLGDDNSARRVMPLVTSALVALNLAFFLAELNGGESFIQHWAFVPRRFLADPAGDFATLFTSMFMHGGWLHLLGNMLYLWIFGDNVEDRYGHGPFVVFYLVCGLAATAAQTIAGPGSSVPNLGASGAIAGVLGAYLLLFPGGRIRVLTRSGVVAVPALVVLGLWIVLQLFSQIGSIGNTAEGGGVAYMAHIGGFAAGYLITAVFRRSFAGREQVA
jgi:membrane associated rhomboid family serine protease